MEDTNASIDTQGRNFVRFVLIILLYSWNFAKMYLFFAKWDRWPGTDIYVGRVKLDELCYLNYLLIVKNPFQKPLADCVCFIVKCLLLGSLPPRLHIRYLNPSKRFKLCWLDLIVILWALDNSLLRYDIVFDDYFVCFQNSTCLFLIDYSPAPVTSDIRAKGK